jgi:hypothetical protein
MSNPTADANLLADATIPLAPEAGSECPVLPAINTKTIRKNLGMQVN